MIDQKSLTPSPPPSLQMGRGSRPSLCHRCASMSLKRARVTHVAWLAAVVAGVLILAGVIDGALAQSSPFGTPRPQASVPPMGVMIGWIFAKQAEFYRQFSRLIRAAIADCTSGC